MYWVTVEGRRLPELVGGHPALDLCNTYAGWGGPSLPKGEWLTDPDALLLWCRHAGLLTTEALADLRTTAAARPAKAKRTLEHVRRLRADLYATLVDRDDEAFDHVAEVAQRAARAARLVDDDDADAARWRLPADLGLDLALLALARAGADLLVSDGRASVRACPGADCGWLFLDRRGTRRWCSMQTCGNRAKTQAFAARRRLASS